MAARFIAAQFGGRSVHGGGRRSPVTVSRRQQQRGNNPKRRQQVGTKAGYRRRTRRGRTPE